MGNKYDYKIFNNIDDALDLVRKDGLAIQAITPMSLLPCSLKGDYGYSEYLEVAVEAVKQNGEALKYIDSVVSNKDYIGIAKAAIQMRSFSFRHVQRYRKEFNSDYFNIDVVDKEIEGYAMLARYAVMRNAYALCIVPDDIDGYDLFATEVVRKYPLVLEFISKTVRCYSELVCAAMESDYNGEFKFLEDDNGYIR